MAKPKTTVLDARPSKPLGVERVVVAHEYRVGPSGGRYLLLQFDCGGGEYRPVGKRTRIPKTRPCIFHCGGSTVVTCAGGCSATADARARHIAWIFHGGSWWCRRCATFSYHPAAPAEQAQ